MASHPIFRAQGRCTDAVPDQPYVFPPRTLFSVSTTVHIACRAAPAMLPPAPYPSGTQHPIPARAIVANPHHSSPPRRSPTSVHRSPPLFPEIPLAQPPTRRASYSASSAPTFNPNPCLPYHPYLHHPAFSSDWSSHSDSVSRRSPPAPAANDFAQQSTKLPRIRTVLGPQLGTSQFPPDRLYSRPYSFDDSSRPRSVSFPFGAGVARAGPSRSSDVHPRHRSADSSLAVYNPPGAVLLNTWPRAISPPVSEDEGEDDGEPRKRKRRRLASEAPRDVRRLPVRSASFANL